MSTENNDNKKSAREFGLTTLAVNNKTTVFFLTFIIALAGYLAYNALPKENFPDIKMTQIYVGTVHPGNSPSDMENLITRPIEKELNSITGVKKISSSSVQDYSTIIVEFESEVTVDDALQDVKDAVDKAKKDLPSDLERDPNIFEMDFSEFPILNVNISGDYSFSQLKSYAEILEDRFEELSEVSKVNLKGLQEEEVAISVDLHKMQSLEISFGDIENAIGSENVTISGGNLLTDGYRRSIRVVSEFKDVEEIENIIIKHEKQNIVYLKDIADVKFDFKEKESYARLGGQSVIMLDVIKRSGSNLIEASDKINDIISEVASTQFPEDLVITTTLDQTVATRNGVNNLLNSIISGVILVVIILLFFLGTRNALFVGIAIPMSMLLSFAILGLIGYTINTMVLFGLIMALGMLVDNGIVVVENVYRLMEDEGYSPIQAAKEGVGEVAWPIISSTATTLAAFLPLALWPGIMGEFMKYLPITLIIVLGSSLFVALVINPVFTAVFMSIDQKRSNKKTPHFIAIGVFLLGLVIALWGFSQQGVVLEKFANGELNDLKKLAGFRTITTIGNIFVLSAFLYELNFFVLDPIANKFQNKFLPILEEGYKKFLSYALAKRRPIIFFVGTWVILIGSIILMTIVPPKVLFFPENEPNYISIYVEEPLGTDIEVTNSATIDIEAKVQEIIKEHGFGDVVNAVITQVGKGTSDPGDPLASSGNNATPHKARIMVEFVEFADRGQVLSSDILKVLRDEIGKYPGIVLTVEKNRNGPPQGKEINIEVVGDDLQKLNEIGNDIKTVINNSEIRGIEEIKLDLETGKPELLVSIDRDKARRYGVSSATIAMELRTSLFGKEISKFKDGEDDYSIQLRLKDEYRYSKSALMNQRITYRDQMTGKIRQVPISALATPVTSSTYGSVKRKDLDRVLTVYSNVIEGFNPTEVNDEIKELLADYEPPKGYTIKFTGQQESQAEEMAFLQIALLSALFLILLIIIAQFNRLSAPIIILSSVLLSTAGVFLGLVIFNMDFIIIMTMIGIISLAGIVVNNAIVLIDFTLLLMERRKEELGLVNNERLSKEDLIECIVQSGKTRLRPVLLTAITTVLGLIPLATGLNIDFFTMLSEYNPNISIGGENVMFWGPMSWTIIFGVTFATFLTLIVVPVMFLGFERLKKHIYGDYSKA